MQKSPQEILETCVKAADARDINAARAACARIAERTKYVDTGNGGRIATVADRAEEALFDLLNYASSFGCCREADRAIAEYGNSVND